MKELKQAIKKHFDKMVAAGYTAFETTKEAPEKDALYELYQDSFRPEDNRIFRERREYDCSACRQFIRNIGGIVFVKDEQKISIWDVNVDGTEFEPVVAALSKHVTSRPIQTVYFNDSKNVGIDHNHEEMENGHIHTWEHLFLELPNSMVVNTRRESIATKQSNINAIEKVFGRTLRELSLESIDTVLELIRQNSLYKGAEWTSALTELRKYKVEFESIPDDEEDAYIWSKAVKVGPVIGKIKNHSIGVLLTDISEGKDLTAAVTSYEKIVAPTNYKRPKPIISEKMIKAAEAKIKELGLESALERRFATAEDIDINDIAFVDRTVKDKLIGGSVFDTLKAKTTAPKSFNKIQEMPIDKFMSDVLPTLTGLELMVENRHQKNLVSLIAPVNDEVGQLFKWNNNFTWAYNGNMTDSDIRDNVKNAGGRIDGIMRFSLQWNDGLEHEKDDLDAYCREKLKNGRNNIIYFGHSYSSLTQGELDIDIQNPRPNKPAVENIVWSQRRDLKTGEYVFEVENFARRSGTNGFRAELEVDGEIYELSYNKSLRNKERVRVATVTYDETTGEFKTIIHVENQKQSKDVWGITTNTFVPVSLVTLSPNHWGDEAGVGNKHFMFMLKDCINNDKPNGFYNEFLIPELAEHRKVFEALGEQLKVQDSDNQLSGLGFSSTQPNSVVVKAKGETERTIKLTF